MSGSFAVAIVDWLRQRNRNYGKIKAEFASLPCINAEACLPVCFLQVTAQFRVYPPNQNSNSLLKDCPERYLTLWIATIDAAIPGNLNNDQYPEPL